MSWRYTYRTPISFTLSESVDAEPHTATLCLRYTVYKGCEPTSTQPGEGPSVSIQKATIRVGDLPEHDAPGWLWSFIEGDEELAAEMLADAYASDEYARDQAADARREEQRLGD